MIDGPHFSPIGFCTPRANSTCAPSTCRVRSPIQIMCPDPATGSAGRRVDPGERLLVLEQQRLVRGVEVHPMQRVRGLRADSGRADELQRLGDPVRKLVVLLVARLPGGEVERPRMDPGDVGIAALAERAQQVQRRRRLHVGLQHPLRIRHAVGVGGLVAVDDVAAVGRILAPVDHLGRRRARLGELAGHAADLHHRALGAEGQDHRHLQHHLEGVADVVGGELGEALGAVAALQQERPALGHVGQLSPQLARLAGENQRRIGGELAFHCRQRGRIGIVGHLDPRALPPRGPGPIGAHRWLLRSFALDLARL